MRVASTHGGGSDFFRNALAITLFLHAIACESAPPPALPSPEAHRAEIEAWQARRVSELTEPDSWLSVVGLFWLRPGENTIGSDPRMDVVLPGNDVPPFLGTLTLRGQGSFEFAYAPGVNPSASPSGLAGAPGQTERIPGQAAMSPGQAEMTPGQAEMTPGQTKEISGQAVPNSGQVHETPDAAGRTPGGADPVLGGAESLPFRVDSPEGGPVFRWGSLSWFVIERYGEYAIRLRDSASRALADFQGLETFPISDDWRILAHFRRYDPPRQITVPNVLDIPSTSTSPGAVVFRKDGREFRLDVTGEPDARQFFLVFGDETNGEETYAGGRFLSVEVPGEGGWIVIDFNRAYNPPCVFTPYATCPVPPEQNKLSIRVEAGEKMYHGAGH
jgi:uncharacterized protein (DUF1684 family)